MSMKYSNLTTLCILKTHVRFEYNWYNTTIWCCIKIVNVWRWDVREDFASYFKHQPHEVWSILIPGTLCETTKTILIKCFITNILALRSIDLENMIKFILKKLIPVFMPNFDPMCMIRRNLVDDHQIVQHNTYLTSVHLGSKGKCNFR